MGTDADRRLEDYSDGDIVNWVRTCEITGDNYRWAAARGYAYLNHERHLGIRSIAKQVGRSKTHVGRMIQIWDTFGVSHTVGQSFSEFEHNLAKAKSPRVKSVAWHEAEADRLEAEAKELRYRSLVLQGQELVAKMNEGKRSFLGKARTWQDNAVEFGIVADFEELQELIDELDYHPDKKNSN